MAEAVSARYEKSLLSDPGKRCKQGVIELWLVSLWLALFTWRQRDHFARPRVTSAPNARPFAYMAAHFVKR